MCLSDVVFAASTCRISLSVRRVVCWAPCVAVQSVPESAIRDTTAGELSTTHSYCATLEDQHMEWKPAGQPEHASLNQCQLIVANRCSGHPQQVVEIRFLCNVIDAGALIGPCSHVTSCCCLIC